MKYLVLLTICLITTHSYAQNNENIIINDWKLVKEENGVQFHAQLIECHDIMNGIHQEYYLFELINNTDAKMEISWELLVWEDEKCINCDTDKKRDNSTYKLILEPGESKRASCDNKIKGLHVFSRFLNYMNMPKLTDYKFHNINVEPILN